MWVERVEVLDFRNLREVELELAPGLNVFWGANAQGKTSFLEAVGVLARARSFRSAEPSTLIRRGASALRARGTSFRGGEPTRLEVEVSESGRRLRVNGREVAPVSYRGRLEVGVYATDRLSLIRGHMRERRLFLDRHASALWPAHGQVARDYERVVRQRNAALETRSRDLPVWDERLVETGARLRQRRRAYVARLQRALSTGFCPREERYEIHLSPNGEGSEAADVVALRREIEARGSEERRAQRSLVGPHRDAVSLRVDGEEAAEGASSGQARSLLLALTLAALEVHREESGETPVALLDDLDSELDEERTAGACAEVARRGQALVTTAHPDWAKRLPPAGRRFEVVAGEIRPV